MSMQLLMRKLSFYLIHFYSISQVLSFGVDINNWKLCVLCSLAPRGGIHPTVNLHPAGLGCPSAFSVELHKGYVCQISGSEMGRTPSPRPG